MNSVQGNTPYLTVCYLHPPLYSREVEINHDIPRLFVTPAIRLRIIAGVENDKRDWKRKIGRIIIQEVLIKLLTAPAYQIFQSRIIMTYFSKPRIHMLTLVQVLLTWTMAERRLTRNP